MLDTALLHAVMGGHDPMDSTSIDAPVPPVVEAARAADVRGMRIGVVKELGGEGYQPGVRARFDESVALLEELGAEVVEVSCPNFDYALAAYYLILPSEASSNLAKFDAMRYGLRVLPEGVDAPSAEQVMAATRDAGFGDEVKRRIILGHVRALSSGYYDAYYGSAQKVRALIAQDFDAAYETGRRARQPDRADDGVQARRQARGPDGHVPQRHRDHPGQPRRRPRHVDPVRPRRRGRPAGRHPDPRPRHEGRAAVLPWAPPSRRALVDRWGGPILDRAPALGGAAAAKGA